MAVRHCASSSGESWIPIQPDRPYVAIRLAERLGSRSPLKKIGGCGCCTGLAPNPHRSKSANSPWYSKRSFVQMPCMISIVSRTCCVTPGEDGRGARRSELLGHPARPDPDVDPTVGELVHRGDLRRQDTGRAVGRVGDAHADPHLRRLGGQPRDQRPTLQPLAVGGHGQRLREPLDHAEGVRQLLAVGGLRDDDPVERPDGVEVEFLGQAREVVELLDGHRVAEVGQVQSELHQSRLLTFDSGSHPLEPDWMQEGIRSPRRPGAVRVAPA